ncbi:MAG TPA: sigma-70 family RNA polymerase sigma factor [Draconibacterium sp.]|nr:sigma-70 family RNA polymerase sigma factor [Draconibacterium sp.]
MNTEEFKNIFELKFDELRGYLIYRCGDEELATDIAQECFMKVWEKRESIEMKQVTGLLFKMASDLFINSFQYKKRTQKIFENLTFDVEDYSPEELLSFDQLKNKYETLVEEMPENQRAVFLMSRIDGLQYKEIAERLGLGVKAVEKRMGIALNYLRNALITEK